MRPRTIAVGPLAVWALMLGTCAASVGDLRQNVAMVSTLPQPTRPSEPSRPRGFPPVTLLWERTLRPGTATAQRPIAAPRSEEVFPAVTAAALPALVANAPAAERRFHAAAVLAVRRVVDLDHDDPAELLNLNDQLDTDEAFAALAPHWQPVLEGAIERAFLLQHFAGALRQLRGAFVEARFDGSTGLYANLDTEACDAAYKKLTTGGETAMALEVTVPPVGRRPLPYFQALCENAPKPSDAAAAGNPDAADDTSDDDADDEGDAPADAAADAEEAPTGSAQATSETPADASGTLAFPADLGPSKLRRLVGKLYTKTFRGRTVRKVAVLGGWKPSEGGQALHAFVAARLGRGAGSGCVIEEISVRKQNGRGGRPRCDVLRSTPVGCETLR
ncbi:MAG: hypothetical protein AAB426_10550 [Myxococcota bacterium]